MLVKIRFDPEKNLLISDVPEKRQLSIEIFKDPSPLELLLISLGACATITAYKSLVLRGGNVKQVEITLIGSGDKNNGNALNEVSLNYNIEVCNVGVKEVEEIIKSSLQKECVVANILTYGVKLNLMVNLKKIKSRKPKYC